MGQYDKDRFFKELAVRFCLARGMLPFLEVAVSNATNLSDTSELITDLDVLGIEAVGDNSLKRTVFDCKTTNKMSAVNRAFWAAGVLKYTHCDEAYVILKGRAVRNHRISALTLAVDLHDEASFTDLGRSFDLGFLDEVSYQSSIDRWNAVHDCYVRNDWSESIFSYVRNIAPLTDTPWSVFRKLIAELKSLRGYFDPSKDAHLSIFFDTLASMFLLWTTVGRDVRRLYEPNMDRAEFETIFRYYIWGGKESYQLRKQLRDGVAPPSDSTSFDLPEWKKLLAFVGIIISAPHDIFACALACREISIRFGSASTEALDKNLAEFVRANNRIRQFVLGLSEYAVTAAGLPKDIHKRTEDIFLKW